ncbi:aminotransferase A [Clostridium felsineum]|uniref:Aminotransferase n=1 Tax=Clostridium felsineum TaxID=36839 RepID=A0A1S8MAH9_9CLOT|nr:aminotransferase A [Clostridium felsineum]MCR3761547.1 aminotransferase A [Clostridium felsineum]URZ04914.1 putative N-acetyl-LL-diaminopimelate aminotransferase [Clostridium felsineum]URZ09955.1 putative N-acetyl-LL-diaminopimelate aminotransferase [Clostridium felsineum]URZ18123.1 putative N-acetyl-LL-diaminopimelate aminotransferase [Clostridium felsineum DSM 794]
MSCTINPLVKKIELSPIRELSDAALKYCDAVNLTVGQPDFTTPEHIKLYAKKAIDNNHTSYTSNSGIFNLREAASNFINKKYNLSYNADKEIIVTNGATEAIDISLRTILEKNDEVLLPAPIYVGYEPVITFCGAKPVYMDTSSNNFVLNAEIIKRHLTEKTKCLILCYPCNPTGSIMDKNALAEIAKLLKDKDIFIISDEIYSELTFNNTHYSIANFKDMRDKVILLNGVSKSHSMTGWRIGFIFAPEYLTSQIFKLHQYGTTCSCSISQYAALEALTNGFNDSEYMKKEYIKRRDFIYEELISMGLTVVKPEGAFYIFPSIKKFNVSSLDFSIKLLEKEHLAVVPGSAFSPLGEGYIRISYAASMNELKRGMEKLRHFINSL